MQCSACGSDGIRKVSLIYEQGLSFVGATTVGTGIGFTRGTHVSALSARLSPPTQKQYTGQLAGAGLSALLSITWSPIIWVITLMFAAAVVSAAHYNRTVWPYLYANWDALFMCERCGQVAPAAALNAPPIQVAVALPAPRKSLYANRKGRERK